MEVLKITDKSGGYFMSDKEKEIVYGADQIQIYKIVYLK